MCRVFSCVVGRGCLLWPVHFLGKTLLVFALLHSVFQGQICRDRHRDRQRQKDRDTGTETQRVRDTETDRVRDTGTDRETATETETDTGTDRQRHRDRQTETERQRLRDRERGRQRETQGQTETETERETETQRQTQRDRDTDIQGDRDTETDRQTQTVLGPLATEAHWQVFEPSHPPSFMRTQAQHSPPAPRTPTGTHRPDLLLHEAQGGFRATAHPALSLEDGGLRGPAGHVAIRGAGLLPAASHARAPTPHPRRRVRTQPPTSWAGPARAAWAEFLLDVPAGDRRDILLPLLSPPDRHFHRPGRSQRPLEELLPAYADLRPVQTPACHPEPVLPSLRGHRVRVWRGQPRQGRHSVSGVEEGVASRLDSGSPDPWQVPGTAPFREAGSQAQPPAPSWASSVGFLW